MEDEDRGAADEYLLGHPQRKTIPFTVVRECRVVADGVAFPDRSIALRWGLFCSEALSR
jgi:hypothetical protein